MPPRSASGYTVLVTVSIAGHVSIQTAAAPETRALRPRIYALAELFMRNNNLARGKAEKDAGGGQETSY